MRAERGGRRRRPNGHDGEGQQRRADGDAGAEQVEELIDVAGDDLFLEEELDAVGDRLRAGRTGRRGWGRCGPAPRRRSCARPGSGRRTMPCSTPMTHDDERSMSSDRDDRAHASPSLRRRSQCGPLRFVRLRSSTRYGMAHCRSRRMPYSPRSPPASGAKYGTSRGQFLPQRRRVHQAAALQQIEEHLAVGAALAGRRRRAQWIAWARPA